MYEPNCLCINNSCLQKVCQRIVEAQWCWQRRVWDEHKNACDKSHVRKHKSKYTNAILILLPWRFNKISNRNSFYLLKCINSCENNKFYVLWSFKKLRLKVKCNGYFIRLALLPCLAQQRLRFPTSQFHSHHWFCLVRWLPTEAPLIMQ